MNINVAISINTGTPMYLDATPVGSDQFNYNILLKPFYAMESDILTVFMEEYDKYINTVSKIIFEQSIKIDDKLTQAIVGSLGMTPQELFRLKRQYVICSSVYRFGRVFHKDFITSVSKSKFLADLKVSVEIQKDPRMLEALLQDAKHCMDEIEQTVGVEFSFGSFVKGGSNPCNMVSERQWYPSNGDNTPAISIAATKVGSFCRKYKIGPNI
jgi:hypothetical protein